MKNLFAALALSFAFVACSPADDDSVDNVTDVESVDSTVDPTDRPFPLPECPPYQQGCNTARLPQLEFFAAEVAPYFG